MFIMSATIFKACTVISLLVLMISFYTKKQVDSVLNARLTLVLDGLVKVEKQHTFCSKKVAVGYGACHDLFIAGKDLLNYTSNAEVPEHFSDIQSQDQLLKSYSYFFRHGAAAERYISNATFFDEIVAIASQLQDAHYALGGNAPVMASRFVREGCQVLLAAKMTPMLQRSLPQGITVVGGDVKKDDIHLIMEYKAEEEWGIYKSPRANRFIVHNDANNPLVSSLEKFDEVLREFEPHLLVISGLQMMDNYPYHEGVRKERIIKIRDQMISQPLKTKVHFEMASFAEASLLNELVEQVIPFADSLGMNEQELTNLYNSLLYGNISLVSDSNPRVATVLDQIRQVMRLITASNKLTKNTRQLSRIHVHTLAYQAIVTLKPSPWKHSKAAAAKASLTAHRHVCGSNEVDVGKAKLIMDDSFSTSVTSESRRVPLDEEQPVSCWNETVEGIGEVEICIAPVLVCIKAYQTAGGGDNISSAGLVLQI